LSSWLRRVITVRCRETPIQGAFVIEPEPFVDDRGAFTRIFDRTYFTALDIEGHVEQANLSETEVAGSVRGLHYQLPPAAETKLVRCTRGALYDVVVDLRRTSPSFGRWYGIELTPANRLALIVPPGCGHGFQTLVDQTDAMYFVSAAYDPERERGVHYADPEIAIRWPLGVTIVSDRDGSQPPLSAADLP
jgi:dTDP-4-dehydrorhamnose 3,5-epimerase